MLLYKTRHGAVVDCDGTWRDIPDFDWCYWFGLPDFHDRFRSMLEVCDIIAVPFDTNEPLLPPICQQEIWAAGLTYTRSSKARMADSTDASDYYAQVADADRPELFFKATPERTIGHRGSIQLRSDSQWTVPEPELTLALSAHGGLIGYTIGNDVTARDIEGLNPLYLSQAKIFDGSAALGPGLYLTDTFPATETPIRMTILRKGRTLYEGTTHIGLMNKSFEQLIAYLFQANSFPCGCFLMTGTGIVPPDDITLQTKDEVHLSIPPLGTLINHVS